MSTPPCGSRRCSACGLRLDELVEDRHDVAVGVLDDVEAHVAVALDQPRQVRRDELAELPRAQERPGVEAVVASTGRSRPGRRASSAAPRAPGRGPPCRAASAFSASGSSASRAAKSLMFCPSGMLNVASPWSMRKYLSPLFSRTRSTSRMHLLAARRVRMQEDGAVLEALGRGDVEVGHVAAVELALLLLHLVPLAIGAVARMDLAEGLHRQEEDQLEMGHAPGHRPAVQRGDESFARRHIFSPIPADYLIR